MDGHADSPIRTRPARRCMRAPAEPWGVVRVVPGAAHFGANQHAAGAAARPQRDGLRTSAQVRLEDRLRCVGYSAPSPQIGCCRSAHALWTPLPAESRCGRLGDSDLKGVMFRGTVSPRPQNKVSICASLTLHCGHTGRWSSR